MKIEQAEPGKAPRDSAWVLIYSAFSWSPFAFEILGIATFLLWASREPGKYLGAVWLLVWLEFLHGVVDDVYLIANGFSAGEYIPFIVIHFIIIFTGIAFARQASVGDARRSVPQPAS